MKMHTNNLNNPFDPYRTLGVEESNPTDESIHQAYLNAVRKFPPEKHPERFQQIREAYERIKHHENRVKINLFGIEYSQSFSELLPEGNPRLRVGAEKWIDMIQAEAKRMTDSSPS